MAPVPTKRPKLNGPATTRYEVGYGKPPEDSRFKPGVSGNSKGRPRGAKNKLPALNEERLKSIILEEAYRAIRINDGERQVKVPMAQAVMRSVAVNAVKGQQRAQRLFAELLTTTERQNKLAYDEWMDVAINYKVEWERELERRRRFNITDLPDPLPHPDHVVIDFRNGTANVRGPATKEEKAEWDLWIARRSDFEAERDELQAMLADPACENRAFIEEELARTQTVLEIIARALPR